MNIIQFIPEALMILVASNYCLGVFLKQSKVQDKFIPMIILLFSIVFSCLLAKPTAMAILQGILCWGTSAGIYDIKNQLSK